MKSIIRVLALAMLLAMAFSINHKLRIHKQDPNATGTDPNAVGTDPNAAGTTGTTGSTDPSASGTGAVDPNAGVAPTGGAGSLPPPNEETTGNEFGKNTLCAQAAANAALQNEEFSKWNVFATGGQKVYRVVSNGPASHVYDAMDHYFTELVTTDFNAAWEAFKSSVTTPPQDRLLNPEGDVASAAQKTDEELNNLVGYEQLQAGSLANQWPQASHSPDGTWMEMLNKYGDGQFLNYKQFTRMLAENFIKDNSNCQNCVKAVRDKATNLFNFIDCYGWGEFTSEMMWKGLNQLETRGAKYDNTSTNDFVLKSGTMAKGSITLNQFLKGILVGYWERKVGDSGIDDHYKTLMALRNGGK